MGKHDAGLHGITESGVLTGHGHGHAESTPSSLAVAPSTRSSVMVESGGISSRCVSAT